MIDWFNILVKYNVINGINVVVIINCKKLLINCIFNVVFNCFIDNYILFDMYN